MSELKGVGYWLDIYHPDDESLPDPRKLLEISGPVQVDERVEAYLRSGKELRAYLGHSYCRFECGVDEFDMGCRDLTDGIWVWPEGLAHYVQCHRLGLPDEFVRSMRENDWQVPDVPGLALLSGEGFSNAFWQQWYESITGEK